MSPTRRSPDPPSAEHFLPLTEVALELLLAIGDGSRHGYGILLDVEERTGGRVRLRPGTLYRALARLADQELIESVAAPPGDEDPRRQYYRATELGGRVLRAELERLSAVLRSARSKDLMEGGA